MKTQYDYLLVEVIENTALVQLNNPKSLNSLCAGLKSDLISCFSDAARTPAIKAVVVTGAGRAFCSGGDIAGLSAVETETEGRQRIQELHKLLYAIRDLEKPVIAAVNGYAVGAGFNLALACDLIIAAEDAKFSEIFANIGLIPDFGGLYFLPRLVGPMKAKELCFTARKIDAYEAKEMGLVNKIVPAEALIEESMALAISLARGAAVSLAYCKRLINNSFEWDLATLLENEAHAQGVCLTTDDFKEGVAAFKQKRPPTFTGK